jgi:hypothetical protein
MNKEFFPSGLERKKEIYTKNKEVQKLKKGGRDAALKEFEYLDSDLDQYSQSEHGHDQPNFEASFRNILPEGKGLREFIEEILEARKGKAIGIEFGGIGTQLFSGFSPDFFEKTFGVALVDHRNKKSKTIALPGRDNVREQVSKHEVVKGNILSPEFYKNTLEKKLNGQKADLIIERLVGGLRFVPLEPFLLSKILQTWYRLLNEGGIMFVEVDSALHNLLIKWSKLIKSKYKGQIELEFANMNSGASVFRLRKLKGAPEELPLLDPRTVKKTEVYHYRDHFAN